MPVITPMTGAAYSSIAQVNDAIRVHVNDTFAGATQTVGEGRIYTNSWTPNLTILSMGVQKLWDDLEDRGMRMGREVQFIVSGITPINGPLGLGSPDPTVQQFLSFGGFWDGSTLNPTVALPYDTMIPVKIQQRITGSGNPFGRFPQAPNGLPSIFQGWQLGWWEWRQDAIWWNGSQNPMDIELTYKGAFPIYPTTLNPKLFSTTLIPIMDSLVALSYLCAFIFCQPRLPPGAAGELKAQYKEEMVRMANRWVQTQQQGGPVSRGSFGSESGQWGVGAGDGAADGGWGP